MIVRLLIICLFLTACSSEEGVLLRWKVPSSGVINYKALNNEYPSSDLFRVNGFDLINDTEAQEHVAKSLKELTLPLSHYQITIKPNDQNLRVKMVSVPVNYTVPPQDETEKQLRESIARQEGFVQLLADIKNDGELISFFLQQKQRNLTSIYFELPDMPVNVNDSWEIPINQLELSPGFVPEYSDRVNKVYLKSLSKNHDGQTVATLFYILAEKVAGQFEYFQSDRIDKFSTVYTYVAIGEFLVEQGSWQKLIAISYLNNKGEDLPINEHTMIHALTPYKQ